jgi:hypothetical protein
MSFEYGAVQMKSDFEKYMNTSKKELLEFKVGIEKLLAQHKTAFDLATTLPHNPKTLQKFSIASFPLEYALTMPQLNELNRIHGANVAFVDELLVIQPGMYETARYITAQSKEFVEKAFVPKNKWNPIATTGSGEMWINITHPIDRYNFMDWLETLIAKIEKANAKAAKK